jgi:RNA polymerase-binding transcription factor DksA
MRIARHGSEVAEVPAMTALNQRFIAELRAALARREEQLIAELKRRHSSATTETFANVAGEVPDAGDASVADVAVDSRSAAGEREAGELEEVRAALRRMDAGSYGLCQECGRPISPQRLRASPTARYDFVHQRRAEHGAGRTPTL